MKLLFAFILFNLNIVFAQTNTFKKNYYNNINIDVQSIKKRDSIKPNSIRKAIILSSLLPGAGQIYNHILMPKGKKKAFWKVPLIYAGIGASTYFLITNQATQKSLKQEYILRQQGETGNPQWSEWENDEDILTLHNQYLNWRDLSIVAVSLAYIIQLTDAGVEAHFIDFDISENISMSFEPTILNYETAAVKLSLNFH